MGRRAINEKQRAGLLDAFRGRPGGDRSTFNHVAKTAGVDWRTARRAWEVGWQGFPPVREQLAEQQVRARAEMSVEVLRAKAAAAPALAAEDAVQAAVREGMLARAHREVNLRFIATVGGPLMEYADALVGRIKASIGEVGGLAGREALAELKEVASVLARSQTSAQGSVVMERLVLGEPGAIIGVKPMAVADVTLEAVEAEVAAVQRALARLKLVGGTDADAR